MVLCLWMYICIFVAIRFEFEFELYIYIYIVRFEFKSFIFFAEKSTVGAAGDTAALTEVHYRGGWYYQPPLQKSTIGAADITSRPYRGHCRGGWKHQPPLQRALQGRSENCPYRDTLCRNTLGRAAGAAAPTEAFEPPLQLTSVVVSGTAAPCARLRWGGGADVGRYLRCTEAWAVRAGHDARKKRRLTGGDGLSA